ncbi:MAG: phosphoribosylformylglycinamidine synthase subunit PurQ [Pseudomonadota bacterium]|nr:phosphoribosylformylglycinamidine synthase subunit PurQ [Pseudomonadota bacterium]
MSKIISIIIFPGSNCDRDLDVAIKKNLNVKTQYVWHDDTKIEKSEIIFLPGGFSFGDYLRAGIIATKSPAIKEVIKFAKKGWPVVGICNGFQILTECKLLDGTLIRNSNQLFICDKSFLKIENSDNVFSRNISQKIVQFPIAHAQGNFFADDNSLKKLEDNQQIIFRYCSKTGLVDKKNNPNGSLNNIAGITNKKRNVLGMMPHPERAVDEFTSKDGISFFKGLKELL